ncbi:MAG: ELWxxDGT repeat protein, partial [Thermoanaerobaculia bacterium]
EMTAVDGTLYFSGLDDASGWELWKSDGTVAGTVRLKDIVPGPAGSFANMIGRVGGTLLILTWRPETSYELWETDGTEAGTAFVRELAPGPDDYVDWLVLVDELFYFTMDDGIHGLELWKSDGTAEGTGLVKDIVPGPGLPTILGPGGAAGKLFFWGDDRVHGHELWMSDGTEEGTVPVKDLVRATSANPAELTVSGDQLFFIASDGSRGTELWKTDGTAQGTVLAHDLSPGFNGSYPFELTDVEGTLFFDLWKNQVWRTDGTPGGLALKLTFPFIRRMAAAGDRLFVDAGELYAAGTGLVKEIRPGPQSSLISHMTAMDGTLFFRADDGGGFGLWRSDGTFPGTFEVAPVPADQLTPAGNTLFFTVLEEPSRAYSLWTSDGTLGGTIQIASWSPGDLPYELTDVAGTLYFGLALQSGGQELWKSDGTPEGTVRVQRIPNSVSPLAELAAVRGSLFFSADGPGGRELWRSDGTGPGTRRVADIFPGNRGSDPAGIVEAQGWAVFAATDRDHGREVWMSDG